jgi:hypothetical protein
VANEIPKALGGEYMPVKSILEIFEEDAAKAIPYYEFIAETKRRKMYDELMGEYHSLDSKELKRKYRDYRRAGGTLPPKAWYDMKYGMEDE